MAASRISSFASVLALAAGAALFFFTETASAQAARPATGAARPAGAAKNVLRIKDMSKPGKQSLVSSPDVDGKVKSPGHINRGQNWKWAMLEVKYETTPDWIDELTFTFYVLCQDAKTKQFHLFQTAVSYLDIEKGDHFAAVMLPPNAVKRYGEPVSYAVDITIDGESVAQEALGMGVAKGNIWWPASIENIPNAKDRLVRHSGYLKDRSQTPFGVTHIDEYEAVR